MLSRVAQFAEKTKALAGTALEALDAPDSDYEERSPVADPDVAATLVAVPSGAENRLKQLVQAVTGQTADNPVHQADALITQISLVRDNADSAKHLPSELREKIGGGSLVAALNFVVETPDKTAETLLEALENEQRENQSLRQKLADLSKSSPTVSNNNAEELILEIARLREQVTEITEAKELADIETQKTHRMLAKVVKEKAEMELERDNEDKVDARVMRSAFATLCSQIDNVSVRNGVLMVMAELLQLSPEDRANCNVPDVQASLQRKPSGLANEFLKFLEEEVGSPTGKAVAENDAEI